MSGLIFSVFILFISFSSWALTPPLSPQQLEQDPDLIVEGEVGSPIQCLGLVEKNKCSDLLKFTVPLKVSRVVKGTAQKGETLKITFFYYDYSKSNCVGDQAAVLHTGDQGKYFLKKLEDGSYQPVHWSGAQVTVHGSSPLPKCP